MLDATDDGTRDLFAVAMVGVVLPLSVLAVATIVLRRHAGLEAPPTTIGANRPLASTTPRGA
ncbi:MAG: hypothetical protein S0880_01600 [Actinomycetota bacterium]|nr:hypothetical protein [Actinomycetota bacterium]